MDMHQKRKIRAEQKNEENQKNSQSIGINWEMGAYEKTLPTPYK